MSADRRLVFEITGDATGWALAVKDAQALNGQAVTNATTLNSSLKKLDEERAASYISTLKAMGSAFVAFAAISEVSKMVQTAIHAYSDYGHALMATAQIMNTTTEHAAVLRYTFESLGLDADATAKMVTTLTRNMERNTAEFTALGVATHDAQGHLRNAYEVITDLQGVVSKAGADNDKLATTMLTVARAAGVGASSIAALEEFLSLTKEQMDANRQAAESLGIVWNNETTVAANNLWHEQQLLDAVMKANALTLSKDLAPAVEWATIKFLEAIEVVKEYGRVLVDIGGAIVKVLQGDWKGAVDQAHQALDDFANAGTWDQISDKITKQIDLQRLATATHGGSGGLPGPVSGGKGGSTAIQDQQAELKAILEKYLAEKQAAIDAINAEKEARNVAFNERIDQINETETLRKAGHADEIARINEEMQTLSDEEALRQRGRDDAIAGLREQIALLDRAHQIETAQDQLARDQHALQTTASEGPVTMRRGEHLEDYYKRVHDHETKLVDETKKINDDKEKIVRDAQKRILEEQIKAIEAVALADRRALEDKKKAAADEIKGIELVQKAEEARTAASIKDLREQMKVADAASAATIKGLQAQMKAEKERVDDQILQLGKLLKAHQSFAGGVAAGHAQIGESARAATAQVEALNAALANVHERARNPDAATANQGTTPGAPTSSGGATVYPGSGHQMPAPPSTPFGWNFDWLASFFAQYHGTQMPETHALGGSMVLSEPTALIGLSTGRSMAVAGAGETATISPRGGRGGSRELTVNVYGLTHEEAVRQVARAVQRQLEVDDTMANASGAVRRS